MSSIAGGQFNSMPFNAGGNWVNQPPMAKEVAEMPRKAVAEDETGDTFTPTKVKPAEKSAFPVASTAIGGGVAGGAGFGLSAWLLPKNQPTELKAKEGKGVTIDQDKNIVEHNGFKYQMEKADGKWTDKAPTVDIGELPYSLMETREFGSLDKKKFLGVPCSFDKLTSSGKASSSKESFKILTDNMIEGLSLKKGDSFNCVVMDGAVVLTFPKDTNKPDLCFNITKEGSSHKLKISESLQKMIDDGKYPDITPAKMKAIVDGDFAKNFRIFEVHDKLPSLKSPERIQNLIQGMGRNWLGIAAITGIAIAAGAGIGYLLGNKQPQQPSRTN
jgi:hypothetical protein